MVILNKIEGATFLVHSGTQKQESKSLQIQETKKGLNPTIKIIGHQTEEPHGGIGSRCLRVGLNELEISPACAELFGSENRD